MKIRVKDVLLAKQAYERVFTVPVSLWRALLFADVCDRINVSLRIYQDTRQQITVESNKQNSKTIEDEKTRLRAAGYTDAQVDEMLGALGKEKEAIYNERIRALAEEEIDIGNGISLWKLAGMKVATLDLVAMRSIGVVR